MTINFDILNRYEYPQIKLCLPNKTGQYFISNYRNLKIKLEFNGLNEVSFNIDRYIGNTEDVNKTINPCYNSVLSDKLLYLGTDFGWFVITESNIENDGVLEYKSVTGVSYEYLISRSEFYGLEGTINLYNPLNTTSTDTIVGMFLRDNPFWSIGEISSDLYNIYRTFDISSSNWYDFLFENIEETYECIIIFDNINMRINLYTPEDSITNTNIYISYNNLINNLKINEKSDEIYNAMDCYGGEDLTVSDVNPMGNSTIYNFSWLIENADDWMTSNLKTALIAWQTKFNNSQSNYITLSTQYKTLIESLVTKQAELTELETILKSKQQALALYTGTDNTTDNRYNVLSSEVVTAQTNVTTKNNEITSVNSQIDSKKTEIQTVVNSLQFSNTDNFTNIQYSELQALIKKTSYQNETFTINSLDTDDDVIQEEQLLYNHCVSVLNRISSPRYTLDCDITNFAFLKEYQDITSTFKVGCQFVVEQRKGYTTKVVCLSATLDYDNPEKMQLEISNRYKCDSSSDEYSDLFNRTIKSSNNFNWIKNTVLDSDRTGLNDEVRTFINSNFDAAKNEIDTANGIKMNISGSGISIQRKYDETLDTEDTSGLELRLLNSGLYLSDDNFNTSPRTAIGRFKIPNTNDYVFGVNAEVLYSKLTVTNELYISNITTGNELSTFTLNADGLTCTNGVITVTNGTDSTLSNYIKVQIDPDNTDGVFTIYGTNNTKKLYVDSNGNLNIAGIITASSGNIGGWTIGETNLYSGSNSTYVALDSGTGTYAIWAGAASASSAPFKVSRNGTVTCQGGIIDGTLSGTAAGWNVSGNSITIGSGTTTVALNSDLTNSYAIWAGAASGSAAPFSVTRSGVLTASNANITGTINANSGYLQDIYLRGTMYLGNTQSLFYISGSDSIYKLRCDSSDGQNYVRINTFGVLQAANCYIKNSLFETINIVQDGSSGGSLSYNSTTTATNYGILLSSINVLKIKAISNLSIDAGEYKSLYIGVESSQESIEIGAAAKSSIIKIYGNTFTYNNNVVATKADITFQ